MRIAIASPVLVEVPPKTFGGPQLMVYELAMGLAARGHKITVFCSGDSRLPHPNIEVVESCPGPTLDLPGRNRHIEAKQFISVLARQNDFDVIHFFYEPVVCEINIEGEELNILTLFKKPIISSFRNLTDIPKHINYYKKNREKLKDIPKLFLSNSHRSFVDFLDKTKVIYNGIDISRYAFSNKKEDYLMFLGRITKEKGILEAIKVAKKTGSKMIVAAKICPADKNFYENEVRHLIDGKQIKYVGEVNFEQKIFYLTKAKALLFPIHWAEPFGLVMAEALACGTPVIGFNRGSVPEIVNDGYNGYVVRNLKEMVTKIKEIDKIKPENCRKSVEEKFSRRKMIDEYEKTYLKLIKNKACRF